MTPDRFPRRRFVSMPTVDEHTTVLTLEQLRLILPNEVRTVLENNLRHAADYELPTQSRARSATMVSKCLRVKAEAEARACRLLIQEQKAKLAQLKRGY